MNALWNTDIKSAPHGRYIKQRKEGVDQRIFVPERVILSTKCGKVVLSHFIPDEGNGRWQSLAKGEEPVAWFAWLEYPHSRPFPLPAANSPALAIAAPGSHLKSAPRAAGDITSLAAREADKSAAPPSQTGAQ